MHSLQSVTEQIGVCAPDRQTTCTRAGHNASWSAFLTADEKCGRCIPDHPRCCCRDIGDWRNVFDHRSRRCIGNVSGEVLDLVIELGHVGIDVWLLSRTRDVPVRAVSLSRGGLLESAASPTARQVAFRRVVPRQAASQQLAPRPAALLDSLWLVRRQRACARARHTKKNNLFRHVQIVKIRD